VSYAYGGTTSSTAPVLRDVDVRVEPREVIALTGANGSGKSTLLQLFNGLLRPSSGTVEVAGEVLGRRAVGRTAGAVGFLFQDTDQQLFERTVLREVSYGPAAAGRHRADAAERARAALAAVGLEQLAGEHPYELGFAQRRFVALASLIASGPALWVLDEPTAGLDQRGRGRMARLILDHAAAGGAVVLATHDESFARAVCTRSLELRDGTVRHGPHRAAGTGR
jgi:energy-coupling factor transport system ATP-binding protein